MILALEGLDRSGKTTLFEELRKVLPGRYLPQAKFSMPSVEDLQNANLLMWDAVYEPSKRYVCDRPVFVSSQVYGRLYNRQLPDVDRWVPEVRVFYLAVPAAELRRRHEASSDHVHADRIERLMDFYLTELERWNTAYLDGTLPAPSLASQICSRLSGQ